MPMQPPRSLGPIPPPSEPTRRTGRTASCGPGDASGWYWTENTGPTPQPEPRDRPVVQVHVRHLTTRRSSEDRSTANPWFWLVIATRPCSPPAPAGSPRGARTAACTSRADRLGQQLVPEADPEHRHPRSSSSTSRTASTVSVTAAGSPGPFEMNRARRTPARTPPDLLGRAHPVRQHPIVSPRSRRFRRMLCFAPQSSTATTGGPRPPTPAPVARQRHSPSPRPTTHARCRATPGTRFAPSIDGADRARSTSSASVTDASSVIAPGTAPVRADPPRQRPRVDARDPEHARLPQIRVRATSVAR
jgi:hypothetical protein